MSMAPSVEGPLQDLFSNITVAKVAVGVIAAGIVAAVGWLLKIPLRVFGWFSKDDDSDEGSSVDVTNETTNTNSADVDNSTNVEVSVGSSDNDDSEEETGTDVRFDWHPMDATQDWDWDWPAKRDNCVKLYDGIGRADLGIEWPAELDKEWVYIDYDTDALILQYRDVGPEFEFKKDNDRFRLGDYENDGRFEIRFQTPRDSLNQSIVFRGCSTDEEYHTWNVQSS